MLYIVPTPIGNLDDMTFRAVEVLKSVDVIFAEDTRTSKKLLDHFHINTPLKAFHAHNEHKVLEGIIDQLNGGLKAALISDAGTPAISDPGFLLVRACHEHGVSLSCLPGATALIPAVVSSGIPADKFFFEGFLPHKKGRNTRLQFLADLPVTFVLYESPFRLVKTLGQLKTHCGDERQACVCRELSKIYEEIKKGTLGELAAFYGSQAKVKGEIVIVVAGVDKKNG